MLFCCSYPHRNILKQIKTWGYTVQEWLMEANDHGAAVDQQKWITSFTREGEVEYCPLKAEGLPLRSMANMLAPVGVPGYVFLNQGDVEMDQDTPQPPYGSQIIGTTTGDHLLP
eukprot:1143257-Ditylum_brightwellii.AAC.1